MLSGQKYIHPDEAPQLYLSMRIEHNTTGVSLSLVTTVISAVLGFFAAYGLYQLKITAIYVTHDQELADIPNQQAHNFHTDQQVTHSFPPSACQVLPLHEQAQAI